MITWHYVTRAAYDAASADTKTSDKLYFLSDTGEIYRGSQNFTESVILFTEEPTVKAVGKLYVNANTLEGKIWNGTAWTTVIQPVQASLDVANTALPVSGKAVSDYVKEQIANVTGSGDLVADLAYVEATNTLTVTMADSTTDQIPLTNVAADLVYDSKTGLLQVKNASGTAIGTGINLDLERFVSAAEYNHETGKIILTFNDADTIEIEIGDLVDTYTAANTGTISMTVTGNQFTAEAIVSTAEGNLLQKTDQGLYVAIDMSGKMDKDTDAVANNLAKFDNAGNAIDAGLSAGGATLAETASASVLATEAAVAAIRTALTNTMNTKMNMVGTGKANEILTATAEGHAQTSGIKVGGATLSATPNAATVATEAAVNTFVTGYAVAKTNVVANGSMAATVEAASDEMVPSEKAVVNAMSWITTV